MSMLLESRVFGIIAQYHHPELPSHMWDGNSQGYHLHPPSGLWWWILVAEVQIT